MTQSTSPTPVEQASAARIQAIVNHGFTERQARFLALVMRHAGVCVPRQYAQVAGIAQGAKCNAFFDRLVRRGHARAIECVHNRARLYLVHSKLLYHAIGEPSSRYRRPVSPRLALERLMVLDAVLSTPAEEWLDDARREGGGTAAGTRGEAARRTSDRRTGRWPNRRPLPRRGAVDRMRSGPLRPRPLLQRLPMDLRIVFPRPSACP